MKLFIAWLFLGCCCWLGDFADVPPTVFTADPEALVAARASFKAGASDSKIGKALEKLMKDAGKALRMTPPAVTDRKRKGPSKDPHDFLSFAPYYWLDPKTGKYVPRDGKRNPEADRDADNIRFNSICNAITALGPAFYVTDDEKYAAKAGVIMRRFFLDKATKMNPNLDYGQVIPGSKTGRKSGIIAVRCIVPIIDAIGMLEGSKSGWKKEDLQGMKDWMRDFHKWLTTSEIGLDEKSSRNNHGSFYDAVVSSIALFIGRKDLAKKTISQVGPERLSRQFEKDGGQPEELKRTQSFHYSLFNLEALSNLASMGRNVGIDLWSYGKDAGYDRSVILAGLEFLAPYMDTKRPWPYKQITSFEEKRIYLANILLRDQIHYPSSKPIANALKIANKENLADDARERILYIVQST